MPAALTTDLKRAISQLPAKEKDKLLYRLIAKDAILAEKMEYELVEEKSTLDHRRQLIRELIERTARLDPDTAGWLMMDMRTVSGYIARHVKVTKDTYGEVELTILMLDRFLERHGDLLQKLNGRTEKCAQYVAKRTDAILKKLRKLDPDYHLEFVDDMNRVLQFVHHHAPAHFARLLSTPTTFE